MPDGNDIVTRLRVFNHHLMVEAADEIERLRELMGCVNDVLDEIERLRARERELCERLELREDADANNEHFRTTDGE
jgi:hypothetical protein